MIPSCGKRVNTCPKIKSCKLLILTLSTISLANAKVTNIIIYGNGNIQNANNSYGAISDASLKENVVDATPKLDDLLKVKIKNFNLISDESKEKQIGVIAQELQTVFPGMVTTDQEGKLGVKYSVFVPILIKAIQELSAKVLILENK